jgi:signal peptidase II
VPRKYVLLLAISLTVIVLDQWTKYAVLRDLTTAYDQAPEFSQRLGVMYSKAPPESGYESLHYLRKPAVVVSENFFRFQYAENPGAAWGLFRSLPENVRGPLFHLVSIGAVILISFYFTKLSGTNPIEKWALYGLPLVLGGAIGNYIDRIARGFVIDFLEAHWFNKAQWPSFNIADTAICVGVGMLVLDAIVRREKKQKVALGR